MVVNKCHMLYSFVCSHMGRACEHYKPNEHKLCVHAMLVDGMICMSEKARSDAFCKEMCHDLKTYWNASRDDED